MFDAYACKSNRVELDNIRYAPKNTLGNSNMRMTTPGADSGSNTPRLMSVPFLGQPRRLGGFSYVTIKACAGGNYYLLCHVPLTPLRLMS